MAYQENKPLATDRLKDSQADIQANFQSNKTAFDQNHVTFDDADAGKHKFMQMPEQGAAPTTAANEMALYTKEQGSASQLFLRRESDGDEINLTNDVLKAADGYTRLPNGLIIKWGTKTVTRNTLSAELTFDATVAFTTVYSVTVNQTFAAGPTVGNLNVAVSAGDVTATGFKAFARAIGLPSGSTVDIFYMAIGV
jgi:hypothetical protein